MTDDGRGEFTPGANEPPLPRPAEEELNRLSVPRQRLRCKLFAWGYEPSRSLLIQQQFRESEEAREFAARGQWEETRAGAWAREATVPMSLSVALRRLGPTL